MSEKKVGKRLLTWVLVLVMTLSLLPLNVLAAHPVGPAKVIRPDDNKYLTYQFYVGEDKVAEQIIKTGDTLREPEVTVQDGKRLTGWYTENDTLFDGFGEYTETIEKNSTVKLYAKFEDVYYVFFKDTTGRIVATKEGVTGAEITFDDVSFPVESDESITGWYLEGDSGKTAVTSVTLESTNVTLCAIVEKGHWITFDSKGGSNVAPQFVRSGESCAAPSAPTKPGYDFDGWYDGDIEFSFGGTLDSNKDLTAHWTAKNAVNYTVIHWLENADDTAYSYKESVQMFGAAGSKTAATAKSYEGFTAQAITQQTINGDGSTIVNVYYKRNVYEVKFYEEKGSWWDGYYWEELTTKRITAKYGADISKQWPGGSWKTSKGGNTYQSNIQTMPPNGASFYMTDQGRAKAKYYLQGLDGKYAWDHTDTGASSRSTVTKEDQYPITGYIFNEAKSTKIGHKYNGAEFYYDRGSFNVVYMNNGKKVNEKSYKFEASIADAGDYELTNPPQGKEGYVFAGWYADPAGEQEYVFTGKTMPAQNITVYAKWVAPVHTVTFMVGKTTYQTMPNVAHKGTITLPAAPKAPDGDTFLGWVDANGKPFHPSTKITGDLKLYAKFGNKAGYSVTYVTEGSSSVTDDKLYAEDAYATVRNGPSTAPKDEVFLYWTNNGKKYYPNDKVLVPKGGVTLTAVYGPVAQALTLTYHANYPEGLTAPDPATKTRTGLKNNECITVAADNTFPAPAGYEFDCWNTKADGTGDKFAAGSSARVDNIDSNDLYARWKSTQITDEIIVTIKGNTSTVTYDGTEKSVTGYTVESSDKRYTVSDFTFSGTAEAKGTDANTYNMGLNAGQFTNTNTNFTNVTFVISTDGKLKIEPRKVTLTSGSGSKVYDGKPLTKPEVTCEDAVFKSEVTEIKATGSVTDVSEGEVTNTIAYTAGEKFKESNYDIKKTEGKLKITPVTDEIVVKITGKQESKVYNGSEQKAIGFTIDSISNGLYKSSDFSLKAGVVAEAKGTDANTTAYSMDLTGDSFENKSKNFSNVKFDVTDGSLTITKRDVTLTSANASKPYDGTALTNKNVTVGGNGFADGEGATYNVTGSQTEVGESANAFTYTLNNNTKESNYNITKREGKLKITAADSVAYKVEHYKQNLDGSYNNTPDDIDHLSGTAGTLTAAAANDYPGFAPGTVTQEKIKSDRTTTIKIQYTRNSYTLTINYVYRDGSKAAESHIETILYGKDYSVTSPKISGYTADKLVVSGTMPADNRTVTVTYTKSGGHHPRPKPTVEIEDDDALGLNTTDHFAYIVGYGNGEVRPQNNITRAEVATIFFRLLTDDVRDENLTKTNRYSDVTRADWYNTAVSTLSSMDIITGYPDGTFRPNAAITRAEFAAISARFDSNGDKTTAKFSDIATHWAKDEISIAYNNGWITGYPNGTFGPQRDITRAETMTLVNRVLNRQPETEDDLLPNMTVWTDNANPNAWYYLAVQEATNSHYYKFKTNSKYEKWTELRETRDWTQLEK